MELVQTFDLWPPSQSVVHWKYRPTFAPSATPFGTTRVTISLNAKRLQLILPVKTLVEGTRLGVDICFRNVVHLHRHGRQVGRKFRVDKVVLAREGNNVLRGGLRDGLDEAILRLVMRDVP